MGEANRTAEKTEVETLLASPLFSRSLYLTRLLRYFADHYFSSPHQHLSEYKIALEALDRPESFDPTRDSSVRVLIFRMRSRLQKYYETEGNAHPIQVSLCDGHYGLKFSYVQNQQAVQDPKKTFATQEIADPIQSLAKDADSVCDLLPADLPVATEPEVRPQYPRRIRFLLSGAAAVCLVAFAALWGYHHSRTASPGYGLQHRMEGTQTVKPEEENDVIRILCGNTEGSYTDHVGHIWQRDQFFTGGMGAWMQIDNLQGSADAPIYQNARIGNFQYDIPAQNRAYELRLHFAELSSSAEPGAAHLEATRIFNIALNRQPLRSFFDIVNYAGASQRALVQIVRDVRPDSDGKVHLNFSKVEGQPLVNGIELIPQSDAAAQPLRMVALYDSLIDSKGILWIADNYAIGGHLYRNDNSQNTYQPRIYDGERFGHFAYQIPVASGCYSVTLHFIERYFGNGLDMGKEPPAGYADVDSRIFDIQANGVILKKNLNILRLASGYNKPLEMTFHNIHSNPSGQIFLEFVPSKNYALVNAIEILYQTPECK
jgi:hypothetical protein